MEHSSPFNRNLPTLLDTSKRTNFTAFSKALLHTSPSQHSNSDLLSDISHPRVRELILAHKDIDSLLCPAKEGGEVRDNRLFLKQFEERRWLTKKGRKYLIDFDNRERKEMKQYFNSLDEKKTGSIGIDELEELLLSVGLFETREEIKALIDSVDEDKSGKIEFDEFLSMIQNDEGQNEEIVTFFKTVIGGNAARRQSFPRSGVT